MFYFIIYKYVWISFYLYIFSFYFIFSHFSNFYVLFPFLLVLELYYKVLSFTSIIVFINI